MAVALGVALGGCSLGADEEAPPASGEASGVARAIDRLERASAAGDHALICRELLTAAALERAGGPDCARLMRSSARGIEAPSIEVRSIAVEGERATVEVVTRARGQGPVDDRIELRRGEGGWRIEGLG